MADPFAAALAGLHASAGAVAAVYTPAGGAPVALRLIRSQASSEPRGSFSGGNIVFDTDIVEVRVADVGMPAKGDALTIAGNAFVVLEEPQRDVEGLTWRFGIKPA